MNGNNSSVAREAFRAAAESAVRELQQSGFDLNALSREGACAKKLQTATTGRKVRFDLTVQPGCQVYVAGTFNNWNPTANALKDNPGSGHCKATLTLPPGRHEYKFVVNGTWMADPKSPDAVPDGFGSLNSVLHA